MQKGSKNGNWKGGKSITEHGYVLVRVGKDHHLADVRGYAYEHRLVAESKLGRPLEKGEIPHHINGNRQDNRPGNIEVCKSIAHHMNKHRGKGVNRRLADESNPMIQCRCGCGRWLNHYDAGGRPRIFLTGHNTGERNRKGRHVRKD